VVRVGSIEDNMQKLILSFRAFIVFTVLLGLIYPLFIMGVGNLIFPYQASGSLIKQHEKIVGSTLIAQEFISPKYFQGRFSAVKYNAADSGASNLAPSSKKLIEQTEAHIKHVRLENELPENLRLPADMVLESASGLDPHISIVNAMLQLPRVASHRGLSIDKVRRLIYANTDPDFIGVWGEAGVNVLQLNLALDSYIK
jgi:potassium-transporting ATPase KdpC subunit